MKTREIVATELLLILLTLAVCLPDSYPDSLFACLTRILTPDVKKIPDSSVTLFFLMTKLKQADPKTGYGDCNLNRQSPHTHSRVDRTVRPRQRNYATPKGGIMPPRLDAVGRRRF